MRDKLITAYLDFFNNYLTVEKYAEHKGVTAGQARDLLHVAKNVYQSKHPES